MNSFNMRRYNLTAKKIQQVALAAPQETQVAITAQKVQQVALAAPK